MEKNSATIISNNACFETEEHVNNETEIQLKQKLDRVAVGEVRWRKLFN